VKTDADLGTTTRFGFRNTTKSGDEQRVFGVPTIRDDILKKGMKSIADPNVSIIEKTFYLFSCEKFIKKYFFFLIH